MLIYVERFTATAFSVPVKFFNSIYFSASIAGKIVRNSGSSVCQACNLRGKSESVCCKLSDERLFPRQMTNLLSTKERAEASKIHRNALSQKSCTFNNRSRKIFVECPCVIYFCARQRSSWVITCTPGGQFRAAAFE